MKIKNEKQALQMFCSKDEEIRTEFLHPFVSTKDGGLIYATDGMILLKVDPALVKGKYPTSESHLTDDWKENRSIPIIFDKIDEARKTIHMVEEEIEDITSDFQTCPDCMGAGSVYYEFKSYTGEEYFHSDTCPTCKGKGTLGKRKKIKTGKMIIPKDSLFEMYGAYFPVQNLLRAVDALRLMGYKKMQWIYRDGHYKSVFQVTQGVRLYIMEQYITKEKGLKDKDVIKIDL